MQRFDTLGIYTTRSLCVRGRIAEAAPRAPAFHANEHTWAARIHRTQYGDRGRPMRVTVVQSDEETVTLCDDHLEGT